VHAGDDPWWDEKWQNAYSLRRGDDRRGRDPVEVFVAEPLSVESWSPHLLRGVLFYVLWTSAWTKGKTWPSFLRPKVELLADGIDGLHYAELVDQLQSLWGMHRVVLPPGREVEPAPVTKLDIAYSAARVVWWGGLGGMVLSAFFAATPEPGGAALIAGAAAALGLTASRVLNARREVELPRRKTTRSS
jgi:hypothetical protein